MQACLPARPQHSGNMLHGIQMNALVFICLSAEVQTFLLHAIADNCYSPYLFSTLSRAGSLSHYSSHS